MVVDLPCPGRFFGDFAVSTKTIPRETYGVFGRGDARPRTTGDTTLPTTRRMVNLKRIFAEETPFYARRTAFSATETRVQALPATLLALPTTP